MALCWLLLSTEGRIGRGPYWLTFATYALVLGVLRWTFPDYDLSDPGPVLVYGYPVAIWPFISMKIKRWHDINCRSWFVLTGVIPILGAVISFVCNGLLGPRDEGNRFGPRLNWRGRPIRQASGDTDVLRHA